MAAAILPPVTEHLDWMKTDTGGGWHRETGDYFWWWLYLMGTTRIKCYKTKTFVPIKIKHRVWLDIRLNGRNQWLTD